ncbi:MAG: 16S rRNA (guanine(527)-N(7))-methyltransferase RsmG [Coriobacteriales bacterium]|jgi:16S rRNA (guanine527-N7)-methyltransferase|nr:16S rRNA (guanine(527)-N(7))-methyltransferase RsmG [Coriobacteriales bacterium]
MLAALTLPDVTTDNTKTTAFGPPNDTFSLSDEFCQSQPLLLKHLQFVLEHNAHVNLTGISDLANGKVIHIEDSLAVLPEVVAAPQGSIADIGSGAGYPGIPLALCSGRPTLLIEATQKKAALLKRFIAEQSLGHQVSVAPERSEAVAQKQAARFSVVTARAVGSLPVLIELAAPLLRIDGVLLALKGQTTTAEIEQGKQAATLLGLDLAEERYFRLSNGSSRRIYTFCKHSEPAITLPRRPGMAGKRLLVRRFSCEK